MSADRHALAHSADASASGQPAALAVVVATEGSTYVRRGAMAVFAASGRQTGWLSGGCLEPQIARHAMWSVDRARIGWMEIDTRDDGDLLSGSSLGCRGRLRIALLPLHALAGWEAPVRAWLRREGELQLAIGGDGVVTLRSAGRHARWELPVDALPWEMADAASIAVPVPAAVTVFGAGPETGVLVPLLRQLGWMTQIVERRPRWLPLAALADAVLEQPPALAVRAIGDAGREAALVMHHDFESDREALSALADTDVPFIGLLGPKRRRDDLFRVLPAEERERLRSRLHSPVGLELGGQGPEAIALSVASQLQRWRSGVDAP